MRRSRRGWDTAEFVLLALILTLLAFVVLPAYLKSVTSQDVARCYAVQRKLDAAIDGFESDTRQKIADLTAALPELLRNGYLANLPVDPGDGRPGSVRHYGRNARGAVYCWVHGSAWEPHATPVRAPSPPKRTFGPSRPPPPPRPPGPITVRKIPGFWR